MSTDSSYDSVSEQFRTYLVEIVFHGVGYYTIWFTDMTTSDEQDKILINAEGEALLFPGIDQLKRYIRSALPDLPDARNFEGWVNAYSLDKPYAVENIDEVRQSIANFRTVSGSQKAEVLDQLDLFNFIGDYRDLVQDDYLEEKMRDPVMSSFFDAAYTFFFWKTPEGTEDPGIDPEQFKTLFNEIIDYFISRTRVVTVE